MNVDIIMNDLVKKNPGELEYHQAVREVLESIEEIYNESPQFESASIIERLIDPDHLVEVELEAISGSGTAGPSDGDPSV